jgi:hypothetical protein
MCARVRILAVGIRESTSDVLACAAAGLDGYVPMLLCRELMRQKLQGRRLLQTDLLWRRGLRKAVLLVRERNVAREVL